MAIVDNSTLERWRALDAVPVLLSLADHAKADVSYVPVASKKSSRWHARCAEREFELLLTGSKFWDTRGETGGGGAVDLVMYLKGCDFKEAVAWLRQSHL